MLATVRSWLLLKLATEIHRQ